MEPRAWASKMTATMDRDVVECVKPFPDTTITPITKCNIYKRDETCHLCEEGFKGGDCTTAKTGPKSYPLYNEKLVVINKDINFPNTDILLAMEIYSGKEVPVQCKKHKYMQMILSTTDFENSTAYKPRAYSDSDAVDYNGLEIARSYPVVTCTAYSSGSTSFVAGGLNDFGIATKVKNDPSGVPASFSDTDCAYWINTGNLGFKCARCMDGHLPIVKQGTGFVLYDSTGNADTFDNSSHTPDESQGAFIESCIAPNADTGTAERIYQGLSFTSIEEFSKGSYISIDNCTSADEIPVIFGKWETSGEYNYQFFNSSTLTSLEGPDTGQVYTQLCMNYTNQDLFATGQTGAKETIGVANCQIFGVEVAFNTSAPTPAKLANQSELKCLSCRPGYKATLDANLTFITACTLITNCDMTPANNSWMNACEKCGTGNAWSYDSTTKILSQDACIDSSNASNCDILDSADNAKCIMCSSGYVLMNDGSCVTDQIKLGKNCSDISNVHPHTALEFPSSTTSNEENKSLVYYQYLAQKNSWRMFTECAACETGYTLMYTPSDTTTPSASTTTRRSTGTDNQQLSQTA